MAVGLGIRLIDGTIVLLPALTILILAPEYFLPIKQVGANYHATLDGQLAMEQIEEILQQQKEIGKKESNVDLIWNSSSNLKLQDVKVKNDESEKAILEGIDFTWNGNGSIGVIGESGAGKSTLIDVLAGFLTPSVGKMIINGVEIDGSTREEWQKNIAYIPQQPYIFPLSLKITFVSMKQIQRMKKWKELLMKLVFVHSLHRFQMGCTKELEKVDVCLVADKNNVSLWRVHF